MQPFRMDDLLKQQVLIGISALPSIPSCVSWGSFLRHRERGNVTGNLFKSINKYLSFYYSSFKILFALGCQEHFEPINLCWRYNFGLNGCRKRSDHLWRDPLTLIGLYFCYNRF